MAAEQSETPMMVQYRGIKEKYKSEVVFFRLGDFYEMIDDDAREVSALLNLTLCKSLYCPPFKTRKKNCYL